MDEQKRAVALLFKRKGAGKMSEKEFVFSASMDLRWFSPKAAQRMMDNAVAAGILEKVDGDVQPTFDASQVDVPMDFRPSDEVLEAPPQPPDMMEKILSRVQGDADEKELIARVNAIQERMNVTLEAAALLMALEEGGEVEDLIDEVEAGLRGR